MRRLNPVSASEHIQALYRLLLIRTGQRIQSEQALPRILREATQGTHHIPSKTDFAEYYRAALKWLLSNPNRPKQTLPGGRSRFTICQSRSVQQ
jgi:hypothetical protein